jgi:hypothetical protein
MSMKYIEGTSLDNDCIAVVVVNGVAAVPLTAAFSHWRVVFRGLYPGRARFVARGQGVTGNIVRNSHVIHA